jgi:hypothetical protein
MAQRKKSKRTVMYSRGGKKLYAVRDKGGKFKDIQSYARSHAADLRRKSKSEAAKPAKPAAKKKAKKKAAAPKKSAVARKAAAKKAPAKKASAKKVPAKKAAAKKAPAKKAPVRRRKPAAPLALPVTAEAQPGPAIPAEVAAEVPPAGE